MDKSIWRLVGESFDSKISRLTAILVKEDDFTGYFSYPVPFSSAGYYFDFCEKSVYDNPPQFRIDFALYSYPDFHKKSCPNYIVFDECRYYPSLINRKFSFSNLGLKCEENFGRAVDGSLSWSVDMNSVTEGYPVEKQLYTVLSSEESFCAFEADGGIEIKYEGFSYYISCSEPINWGVYADDISMKKNLHKGRASAGIYEGHYLVIEHKVNMKPGERANITMGLSSKSAVLASEASKKSDIAAVAAESWNRWFHSLPKVGFVSEREKKAYYKCWGVIKNNYYEHPEWGFSITEALPVYKGIWQWAIPSVEWHSDQNTEFTSQWIRKAMDLLINGQREDGYITHAIYIDEENPGERWAKGKGTIQTPHFPWVALRYYHTTGDRQALECWYGPLEKYYRYLCSSRDTELRNLHLWGIFTSFDTGLDTTPVFQKVTYGENGVKEAYCYPAIFAAERFRYEEAMGKIAEILGLDGGQWKAEAEKTKSAMEKYLWDDDKKWYGVLHEDGTLDTRVGVDGLFPLVYHMVEKERASHMKACFERLIGPYGIRTVAPGEAGFREDVYWRGPAWAKSCSLGMEVCRHYYPDMLDTALNSIINMALSHPNIWECYNVSTGELARSDQGFICTPCMSSNVGAGDILGCLWMYHGFDMYGMEGVLPLTEMEGYHLAGMRITITPGEDGWVLESTAEEAGESCITLKDRKGNEYRMPVRAGVQNFIGKRKSF